VAEPTGDPGARQERWSARARQTLELRQSMGDPGSPWTAEEGGVVRLLLFGDLHEHTEASVCERTYDEDAEQTFQMMREVVGYDFGAITDHGHNLNAYLWNEQSKQVRAHHTAGLFTTFLG